MSKKKRPDWLPPVQEGVLQTRHCKRCGRTVVRTRIDGVVTDLEPRLVDGQLEETAWQVGLTTFEPVLIGRGVEFNWRNPWYEPRAKAKVAVLHICPPAPAASTSLTF